MIRWMGVLGMLLTVVGCADAKPPPAHEVAAVASGGLSGASGSVVAPSAPAPSVVAPSAPAASTTSPSGQVAKPDPGQGLPATVGDVTCSTSADCTTTTKADCCECCASNARATSKAWLAWRDKTECPKTRCEPCGKVKCPFFGDPASFDAVCISGACTLFRPDDP